MTAAIMEHKSTAGGVGGRSPPPPLWIETDLEPDDVLALYMLAKKEYKFAYIVTGRGSAATKTAAVQRYLELLKAEGLNVGNPIIVTGLGGHDSEWPGDGKQFEDLKVDATLDAKKPEEIYANYRRHLTTYLRAHSKPIMVLLKPFPELLEAWYHGHLLEELDPKKTEDPVFDRSLVAKAQVFLYGSFNLRCLLKGEFRRFYLAAAGGAYAIDSSQIPDLRNIRTPIDRNIQTKAYEGIVTVLEAFESATVFETFHALGEDNAVNAETEPELYRRLKERMDKEGSFLHAWQKHMLNWNRYLLEDSVEDACKAIGLDRKTEQGSQTWLKMLQVKEPSLERIRQEFKLPQAFDSPELGKFWRNYKIARHVADHVDFQFVLADVGVAVVMHNADMVPFRQEGCMKIEANGYTAFRTPVIEDHSQRHKKIFFYKNVDRKEFARGLRPL